MRTFCGVSFWIPLVLALAIPLHGQEAKPAVETLAAWDRYIGLTERQTQAELNNPNAFVRSDFNLLKTKDVSIQRRETKDEKGRKIEVVGGSIHHWLGAVFVPGKDLESVLRWVRDYDRHQDYFKDVEQSSLKKQDGETYEVFLRLRRSKMGVTARFNTDHRITYSRHDPARASSKSVGTRIRQLDKAGNEYAPGRDSGYLWRLNSYWRFDQRNGGVVVECESVGLSRPLGSFIGFLDFLAFGRIKRIAESVAEEALRDTLTALRDGVLRTD
jgi:hypothetical protein